MNNRQESSMARDNGLCTFLADNALEYAGDAAFEAIVIKTTADYAHTKQAAADAAADNTGYSLNKVIARDAASISASQLCASSQVKLDLLENTIVSESLNAAVSFYSHVSDTLSASRLQNVHDVMSDNQLLITDDYVTVAQLAALQTKITNYTKLSGSTTSVNATAPVKTQELAKAIRSGATNVVNIMKLARKYITTNPTFHDELAKVCKIPALAVRHTPVIITVTAEATDTALTDVHGTLSKTKDLGVSTSAGIITYTNVSAGTAIATCSLDGYITCVKTVKIKRGKTNEFTFALVAGTMTSEMEVAIAARIKAFTTTQEAKKVAKMAKAKLRKEAKKAKAKL